MFINPCSRKLLYADKEKALELDSKEGSRGGAIDYSLLLDGLMAEREQGITIDVNTGEKKEATSLEKNEIAVCELQLADSIVVDTFAKHKTLGELILIDRITNMTSACGVVNQVYKDEAGVAATVIDREARSNWKGQRAITVELNDVGIVVLLYAKKDLDTSIFNSVGEIPHLTKR